jgi:hypothetical protein
MDDDKENNSENNINNEEEGNIELNNQIEEKKETELKEENEKNRIFYYEKVKSYYNNQKPPSSSEVEFKDNLFPTTIDSLMDNKKKTEYVDRISINEIEWKKLSEILKKEEITIFSRKDDKIDLSINFKENKGELFSHYTSFFQAMNLLSTYPNIIE